MAAALAGCAAQHERAGVTLKFWAMGREGEVVQEQVREFEREYPGVHVIVQQIPWTAAHEKLLTAEVGRSTPDVAQLGNTWIPEFAALRALEPLDAWVAASRAVDTAGYFRGIWDTNVIDRTLYGVPWYVDTRVLFYRRDLLARAGFPTIPGSWKEWRAAMEAVKRQGGKERYPVFLPTNEWTQAVIFGLQSGSPILAEDGTRGAFSAPEFRRAFDFYLGIYRDNFSPRVNNIEIANVYQEFGRGTIAMWITGPWNLGEFRRRLPPEQQDSWATAPLPGPDGPASGVSTAGGSSLVLFRGSRHKQEAWRLIEFLSRPDQQVRFYALTGDLPARREAWRDTALTRDPGLRAFETQLQRVTATPKIPEWEQIAQRLQERAEFAIRGGMNGDSVLAGLDRDVDRMLEKRRWLIERGRHVAAAR
jgi:multiple sugar transport system substrate-binding protein